METSPYSRWQFVLNVLRCHYDATIRRELAVCFVVASFLRLHGFINQFRSQLYSQRRQLANVLNEFLSFHLARLSSLSCFGKTRNALNNWDSDFFLLQSLIICSQTLTRTLRFQSTSLTSSGFQRKPKAGDIESSRLSWRPWCILCSSITWWCIGLFVNSKWTKVSSLFSRLEGYIWAKQKIFRWDDLLGFVLPLLLAISSKETLSFSDLYNRWCYVILPAEFIFACIFFNRGHHCSHQIHQNDEIKSFDFGEYQLSTTVDRSEANANSFTSLALYGDHVLHQLFPTLDSSILPQLRETLRKTCKEFDIDLNFETTILRATLGQFKQLYRTETIKCS